MKLHNCVVIGLILVFAVSCSGDGGDNSASGDVVQSSIAEQEAEQVKTEVSASHKIIDTELDDGYQGLELSDEEKELLESLASQ